MRLPTKAVLKFVSMALLFIVVAVAGGGVSMASQTSPPTIPPNTSLATPAPESPTAESPTLSPAQVDLGGHNTNPTIAGTTIDLNLARQRPSGAGG
jgi:ABC-type transport system substrate-binding protein